MTLFGKNLGKKHKFKENANIEKHSKFSKFSKLKISKKIKSFLMNNFLKNFNNSNFKPIKYSNIKLILLKKK
jgi:hypothetical protein